LAIRHLVAALALSVSLAGAAHADEPGSDGSEDAARTGVVRPVFDQTITNIPGKSLVAQETFHTHQAPKTVRTATRSRRSSWPT
jgi:hypothetical protein